MGDFDEGKVKRDEHGKFSATGAAAKAKLVAEQHEREKRDRLADYQQSRAAHVDDGKITALHRKALTDGGFTYDAVHDAYPTQGYVVSSHPEHERIVEGRDLTEEDLRQYVADKKEFLDANPNARVGAWHDAEAKRWYLDISHVTTDRDEALQVARDHNQEAVYDLGKRETVFAKERSERRGLPEGGGSSGAG